MKRTREDLVRQFVAFHLANPGVYVLFKRFAYEAIAAGRARLSARLIVERIRWETTVTTVGAGLSPSGEILKINDVYIAYYARLFMIDHPTHDNIFELRKPKA